MGRVDALNDLKRLKRKCKEFSNELDDFKRLMKDKDGIDSSYQKFLRYILDNAGLGSDDNIYVGEEDESDEESDEDYIFNEADLSDEESDEDYTFSEAENSDEENEEVAESKEVNKDHPVKNNKILQIQVKVEKKTDMGNSVSEKMSGQAPPSQPGLRANSQKQMRSPKVIVTDDEVNKDHPVKNNKILQIQVKVEKKTDMGNSVSEKMSGQAPPSQPGLRANSQKQMRSPKVIVIDDDDEDLYISSGQKDKGKSVVSDIPEVEILDNAALSTRGNPFVPSKNYHKSVSDENDETLAFRNDVLKVLREPFNPTEYDRLYKDFIGGSYHVYYKDVKKKLHKTRREKRWIILRGFFFWLQNLPRPGAFEPWNDRVCLEVEPHHVGEA